MGREAHIEISDHTVRRSFSRSTVSCVAARERIRAAGERRAEKVGTRSLGVERVAPRCHLRPLEGVLDHTIQANEGAPGDGCGDATFGLPSSCGTKQRNSAIRSDGSIEHRGGGAYSSTSGEPRAKVGAIASRVTPRGRVAGLHCSLEGAD